MVHSEIETFGKYLYEKRSPLMTLREMAAKLDKSIGYLCDLENDRKDPPNKELLEKIAEVLSLNDAERIYMFDLAGKGRKEVSADLPDYIMDPEVGDTVRYALRTAKNSRASLEDWLRFAAEMLEKQRVELQRSAEH
jgi:transcriptional regulator with XRE-family HTH domain